MPKIAILIYSTYGHIAELARKEAEGVIAAGGQVDLYQVEETLSEEILKYMKAPGQPQDFKVLTPADVEVLTGYDGFLFGIPSRFGSFPAQWKTFWDATGGLWANGGLHGKYVGQFVSSGTQGGGQEVLPRNTLSIYVHHGMNYVPLGYKDTFAEQTNLEEVHGGSPWGAGTFADSDGSRTPSPLEEKVAFTQGKVFAEVLIKAEGGALGAATNGVQNGAQQKTLDPKAGGVNGGEAAAAGVGAGAVGAGAVAAGTAGSAVPPADAATATNTGTTAATGAAPTEKGASGTTGAAANTTTAKPTAAASKPATTEKAAAGKKTNPAKDVKEEKSKCCGICTIM